MRILTTLIGILYYGILLAQTPGHNELYQKIVSYYQQNPHRIEFMKNVHKNALRYDTNIHTLSYVPLEHNNFYFYFIDSTLAVDDGLFYANDYFVLTTDMPRKIRLTKRDLKGSMYSWLNHVPAWNSSSTSKLSSWLGSPVSITSINEKYVVLTKEYIVEVDKASSRITKITWVVYYKNQTQYNEYHYLDLPDSVENSIKSQVIQFTNGAKDFPITTWKEIGKNKPSPEQLEGKAFQFRGLVSINQGSLDSIMKNKYVIFDFFYLSCLPCHKMTGYILDWLPRIDTSKVMLVGINPADTEFNMKMEIDKRKISYPVIIGNQAKEIAKRYVQGGYPNLLLISPSGIILDHHIGMSKSFLSKAEKIISQ